MKTMRRAALRTLSASLVLCSTAAPALADRVERVKDVNTAVHYGLTSTPAHYFDAGNGVAYFQAYQPATGRELWRTDGTEIGTYLVKDINPGSADSSPQSFTAGDGFVFFVATHATYGAELWRTDGTAQGTTLVKDVWPGSGPSSPESLVAVGGTVYFGAYYPSSGRELWKSDGTPAGTVLVKDVNPGIAYSSPAALTAIGGKVYFRAFHEVYGTELWSTDGTDPGTELVKDIRPGFDSSNPGPLRALGGFAYFSADDGVSGAELWRTDGTPAGTTPVLDLRPGALASLPVPLAVFGGGLYFSADDGIVGRELWRTDGTAAATTLVRDILPGPAGSAPSGGGVVNGALVFAANDGTTGAELWRTDGTPAGTLRVADIWPGSSSGVSGSLTVIGAQMVFVGGGPGTSGELWRTDGTGAGTFLLRDIRPGSEIADINFVAAFGERALFGANDGPSGREPWLTDGTPAGTVMVRDVHSGAGSANPAALTEMNGFLYFAADRGFLSYDLWKTDGTEAGTVNVTNLPAFPAPPAAPPNQEMVRLGDTLVFTLWTFGDGSEIWTSDGVAAAMVTDLCPGPCGAPKKLTAVGGIVYFVEAEGGPGAELYRTDGTASGTGLLKDIVPGPAGSSPESLTAFQGQLFFSAFDGSTTTLWRSDGTAPGTVPVVLSGPRPLSPRQLTVAGPRLFFVADEEGPLADGELWVTDGTSAGTRMVVDIRNGISSNPENLTAVGNLLYFTADDGDYGVELWRTDGTPAGTVRVTDIAGGPASASPRDLVAAGDALYFSADDGFTGRELWSAERAPGPAIVLVEDIVPGPGSSNPRRLVHVDGTILFTADGPDGAEVWRSLGWPGTTQLVHDVEPGPSPSNPAQYTPVASGDVFFTANTTGDGTELRILRNRRPVADAGPDVSIQPGETTTLSAAGSADPDGDPLFFEWRDGAGVLFAFSPTVPVAPAVTTTYRLTVRDGFGGTATDLVTVIVDGTPTVSLALSVYGTQDDGRGTVSVDPPGAICDNLGGPQTCTYDYAQGTPVTLLASPLPDSIFVGWQGACTGTGTCQLAMDASSYVEALFRGPVRLAVEVNSYENGYGSVHISPPDQSCANAPGTTQYCESFYRPDTMVTLQATPAPDSVFMGWTNGCGLQPTCVVTMSQAVWIAATFRGPQPLLVIVDSYEAGYGSVLSSPPDAYCSNTPGSSQSCETLYRAGTTVTLTAMAGPDSVFMGWGGACSGLQPTCTVTMEYVQGVSATFRGPQPLLVIVDSFQNGYGSVRITPPDAYCSNTPGTSQSCESLYRVGTTVTLEAFAGPDSIFIGWSGSCSGTQPTCEVTVSDPTGASALFRGPQPLLVIVESFQNGHGSVRITPPDAYCSNTPGTSQSCESLYRVGTTVTLEAFAGPDSIFIGWSGSCSGTQPTCEVTVSDPTGASALFRGPQPLSLTLTGTEGAIGRVDLSPAGGSCELTGQPETVCTSLHRVGDVVTLTATAGVGSVFVGFTGCSGTDVCTVTMDEARAVGAAFRINHPPAANAGGPYSALRNVPIAFDGTGSSDPDGDPLTYAWDFGDGSTATGAAPTHAYATVGAYTVTLVVHDGRVASAPATAAVTITNARPVAVIAGGPRTAVRGDVLSFDGSGSTDGDGDPLTYAWDFGDGATAAGATPAHAWTSVGVFTVTLVVHDGIEASAPATVTVTIENRAPVADPGGPYSGFRGTAVSFDGSGSSDADGDPLTYAWSFGDGATGTGASPSHTYTAFGTFVVTLVVNDGFADSAPVQTQVTVPDRPPVADAGGPYAGVRGVAVVFDGSASVDPDGNPLTYAWDFGDGTTGTGVSPGHVYATLGTFTARLVVSDGGPQPSAEATAVVTISNRAPVAGAGGPYSGTRIAAVVLDGSGSSDPDGDPLTYAWDFGDGTTGSGASPSHLYATLGTFTVTLTVHDGYVSSAPVTTTVTITNVAPVANAGPDATVKRRTNVALDGTGSVDPDGVIAAWAWRQLSGPAVALAGANTAQPGFQAPNTVNPITLDFEVQVTDDDGASTVDVVTITVVK